MASGTHFAPRSDSLPAYQAGQTHIGTQHNATMNYQQISDVARQLLLHPQLYEYYNQICVCIEAEDDIWQNLLSLCTDPRADRLARALHLFLPPYEIWNILVQLRSHSKWELVRHQLLAQLRPMSSQARSERSSGSSFGSAGAFSSAGTSSTRTSAASFNNIGGTFLMDPVDEGQEPDVSENAPNYYQPDRSSSTSNPGYVASRSAKTAPKGFRFFCLAPTKRGREQCGRSFKRVGDYTNHMDREHSNYPWHDPYRSLGPYNPVRNTIREENDEVQDNTPVPGLGEGPGSPSSMYAEISVQNDPPATGHEYHFGPSELSNVNTELPMHNIPVPPQYFQAYGVNPMTGVEQNTNFQTHPQQATQSNHSFFNHED